MDQETGCVCGNMIMMQMNAAEHSRSVFEYSQLPNCNRIRTRRPLTQIHILLLVAETNAIALDVWTRVCWVEQTDRRTTIATTSSHHSFRAVSAGVYVQK